MRRGMIVMVGVLVAACGNDPLVDLGTHAGGWIDEPERVATTVPATDVGGVVLAATTPVTEVSWFNDDLGVPEGYDPAAVISAVGARRDSADQLVQASRFEVAVALPGLEFPAAVPKGVVHITSQLAIAPDGSRLDDETYAAFGLWTVEPYTQSRRVGQMATITVRRPIDDATVAMCDKLVADGASSCQPDKLAGRSVARVDASSGQTWVWEATDYQYRLFLRGDLAANRPAVEAMIGSTVPFAELADPSVRVLGAQIGDTPQ